MIFGAGGRAGKRVVAEALARGHRVTAVVRDPAGHPGLTGEGVEVVAGDVTDADSVATLVAGHDAVVQAAWQRDLPVVEFFGGAARALLTGLDRAGVDRLVLVGIGLLLETEPGVRLLDAEGLPEAAREFSLGHLAELEVLADTESAVDWVLLAPPPTALDEEAERTGEYRTGDSTVLPAAAGDRLFSYADLAVAVVDEVEQGKHHRALVAIG
nr:NAD(P)H-binding protein [Streptomyces sp. SID3343]